MKFRGPQNLRPLGLGPDGTCLNQALPLILAGLGHEHCNLGERGGN